MNAYCPDCETELDQATGICPACRWDPTAVALAAQSDTQEPVMSLTERYRGSEYDITLEQVAVSEHPGVSRARSVILVGLVGGVVLYGAVLTTLGIL